MTEPSSNLDLELGSGIFAPFKEVFAPYQPSDYDTIVTGR